MACRWKNQNACQNTRRQYQGNGQYSIIALTDGSGGIVERYAYSAYGTPTITDASGTARTTSAESNRYTYTGREWDKTLDVYHYRARMYDSLAGRFCSRDPIGYVDGKNLYRAYFVPSALDPEGLKYTYKTLHNSKVRCSDDCNDCSDEDAYCRFSAEIYVGPGVVVDKQPFFPGGEHDKRYPAEFMYCSGHSRSGGCVSDWNRSVGDGDSITITTEQGSFTLTPSDFDPDTGNPIPPNDTVGRCFQLIWKDRYREGDNEYPEYGAHRQQCFYWERKPNCPKVLSVSIKAKLERACVCGRIPVEGTDDYDTVDIEATVSAP